MYLAHQIMFETLK